MNLVQNQTIKNALFNRWKELELRAADVIKDAEERGMKITSQRLSRYKTGKGKEAISQSQLLWLCTRWGVFVTFNIGEPVIDNSGVRYVIKPYDEAKCLKLLNKLHPNVKPKQENISEVE